MTASAFELLPDILILYTDGITEVTNNDRELLAGREVKEIVISHGDKDVNGMLNAIKNDLESCRVGVDKDDISLVLIRRIQ